MATKQPVWVAWDGQAKRAHAAALKPFGKRAVRAGSFPLACGRYAPDGTEFAVYVATDEPHCKRCESAVA